MVSLKEQLKEQRKTLGLDERALAEVTQGRIEDVRFVETYGVGVSGHMLALLDYLGIQDYESMELARLGALVPGGQGPQLLRSLVERGHGTIEEIEQLLAGEDPVDGLSKADASKLRGALSLYQQMERLDDPDQS